MNPQRAYEHARYLAEECGPRPAGSGSMQKAVKYVADCLETMGSEVERHRFVTPVTGLRTSTLTASLDDGAATPLGHTPVWFAGDTGPGGVEAPVVYGGDGSRRYLDQAKPKGKALVLARDAYMYYPDNLLLEKLRDYEPACVLYTCASNQVGGPPEVYYNYLATRGASAPPSAVISLGDAERLVSAKGAVVKYLAEYEQGETTCANVVGTLEGSDRSAGDVLICAHADTTVRSPGASDDGAGVGLILALAEQYAQARRKGRRPRRTLHVAAWSGHESGLHGSRHFVTDHADLMQTLRMVVVFDVLGATVGMEGLAVTGNQAVCTGVGRVVAEQKLDGWQIATGPGPVDAVNFYHSHIPTVTYSQALPSALVIRNHTPADDMAALSVSSFATPLDLGRALVDWALESDEVSRGYPDDLDEACRGYATMFGWGLYGHSAEAGSDSGKEAGR